MEQRKPLFGSALILAGGSGSRIGYDKKNLLLNGKSVIGSLIAGLHDVFDEIIVSSNNEFKCKDVIVLPDLIGAGPLAGIYQGLTRCNSEYLYVIACDMPFISPDYIAFMKNALMPGGLCDACVAQKEDGFLEPFNAFWKKSCTGPVRAALESGVYKIGPLLKRLRLCVIPPDAVKRFCAIRQADLFFNINFGADLREAAVIKAKTP
ncbi:MAG: molybdenum cofactor guanylyltransferase [Spirochaetaceae bacterium]|jgi:molybdopterin-guanine dinucleotide biosynthesis protein A|nr:molybdenum cofactor guanylyltransferase [Spirochaetaceae bacterium]